MKLDDPRAIKLLAEVRRIAGADPGVEMDLMLTMLCLWSARYAGCAALLQMVINVLSDVRDVATESLKGHTS